MKSHANKINNMKYANVKTYRTIWASVMNVHAFVKAAGEP